MSERSARPLRALFLLAALPLLAAAPLAAQDDGGGGGDQGEQGEKGGEQEGNGYQIRATDPVDAVLVRHYAAHGGRDKLRSIRNFAFRWVPEMPSGKQGKLTAQPPLDVEIKYAGARRVLRIEETLEGKRIVKLSDGIDTRVWVDGTERKVPEMIAAAREEAISLLSFLDLLYQPDSLELSRQVEGPKVRDDVKYTAMRLEFHPSRQVHTAFRNYYNPDTGLVDRMDVFALGNLRRLYSIWFENYVTLDTIQFPTRMVFKDREGELSQVWRFEEPRINAELAPERFTGN